MKFSVLIATHNRAGQLRDTLRSLAGVSTAASWEAIVVDNNSRDDTRDVVRAAAETFPVALRYLFEPEQGKAAALNAGMRISEGEVLVFTDDDVRFETDWLDRAGEALEQSGGDYVGGKVLPIWGGPRPAWLPNRDGQHWAVVALLDYGTDSCEFGRNRVPWPLGVNMAVRREAFDRTGPWDNRFDRKGNTLRGQGQREWCLRARASGLRGFYAPRMVVHHIVPDERLNRQYFRRWFYWHGIGRATLYREMALDMEAPDDSRLDFSKVPHVVGVPRYMFRTGLRSLARAARGFVRKDPVAAFEHELWLWFFAGVVAQRWKDRKVLPLNTSAQ
jgi:glycosyltransferase involved in cell wall biosynthesis